MGWVSKKVFVLVESPPPHEMLVAWVARKWDSKPA